MPQRSAIGFWVVVLAVIGGAVWASLHEQRPTPVDQAIAAIERKKNLELDRLLCRKMAACGKYDRVRVQCATAGNIGTCLRIKMGDDAPYIDLCGGDKGPAAPLDRTPNAIRCFFLNN